MEKYKKPDKALSMIPMVEFLSLKGYPLHWPLAGHVSTGVLLLVHPHRPVENYPAANQDRFVCSHLQLLDNALAVLDRDTDRGLLLAQLSAQNEQHIFVL